MRCSPLWSRSLVITAVGLALSACNGIGNINNGGSALPPSFMRSAPEGRGGYASSGKIQHIVIVVQENRSFNDLFEGYPGATTASFGYDSYGNKIALNQIGLETSWDLEHDSYGYLAACNGTGRIPGTKCQMNGFNKEWVGCGSSCPYPDSMYAYVPHKETAPYFTMANQYVLADEMYASNFDASSFISHQYIISAQAEGAVNYPYSSWGCPGGSGDTIYEATKNPPTRQPSNNKEVVCWNPTTLGDELDTKGISWAFYGVKYSSYTGIWMAYQAIDHIYHGSDWSKDNIGPPSQFLTDVTNGNLRAVTWVTPTCANSDHAGCGSNTGPSWVTSIVNTIGQSKYWDSTAIFIMWDDYGGWYDPEPPVYKDYDGLGMRIPLLIISPYAKKDHVSHVHYEHGSILKFVEDTFGLGRLAASDTRAISPARDCFNFNQAPRKFQVIGAPYDKTYFLHQPLDVRPVDTN